MTAIPMVEPFRTSVPRRDVTVGIEEAEGVSLLQGIQAPLGQGGGCGDLEAVVALRPRRPLFPVGYQPHDYSLRRAGSHGASSPLLCCCQLSSQALDPHELLIEIHIITCHPAGGEALFEAPSDGCRIETIKPIERRNGLLDRAHMQSGQPVLDDFRYRAAGPRNHRRAACYGLDHHQAEGLWPIDREKQCLGTAQELRLLALVDLAYKFDQGVIEQRTNFGLEVVAVGLVHLRRYFQGDSGTSCDLDGAVRSEEHTSELQ